ncbi:MAG: hypothetical protein Q8P02_00945, partial [Candidatus Micrarchaeota archaeon]|nr:hypothetical protein [Candidatus Micrarchaeota archaeon]
SMRKAANEQDATVITQEAFLSDLPSNLRAPFAKSHGGWRNMALAASAREKKDMVFLDDDTTAQNDVFNRFSRLLAENGVVLGKYAHHVGGASTALLDLTHALEKLNAKKISETDFLRKMEERYSGVPPAQKPVESAGAVGGCLGVTHRIAATHCFFPAPYRIEDGTFAALCPEKPFNPPLQEAPVVRHEKTGRPGGLAADLENEWTGNVLAGFILAEKTSARKNAETLKDGVKKGLLLDYFCEKYEKSAFRHAWLDRIASLDVHVTDAQCRQALLEYDRAHAVWPEAWQSA